VLYTITDVEELGTWMKEKLDAHPMFERISDEALEADPAAQVLSTATEEGQKVARNKGSTWRNCYRRREKAVIASIGSHACAGS
jgi:tRNA (guanine-N7-)-methyltransferase